MRGKDRVTMGTRTGKKAEAKARGSTAVVAEDKMETTWKNLVDVEMKRQI